jgi:hypothetical protein
LVQAITKTTSTKPIRTPIILPKKKKVKRKAKKIRQFDNLKI